MKVFFKYVLIVFFVILFACFIIIKNKAHKANVIELNKEPTFINTSINDELLVIVDGELVKYDSQLNTINVELDLIITKAYGCDDDLWVIDDKANLYNLYIEENNTYELSDVILENVEYVTGDTSGAIAITTEGDVYVWGRGDEYCSIGLDESEEVKEPIKVDGISNATEVARFHINTAVLTESGELYVVGGIINSKWSEEEKEYVVTTDVIKEYTKVQHNSRISYIGELENLYTVYEDGTISAWSGIKINDYGDIVLDSETCDWNSDLRFTQISFGEAFAIAIDSNNNIYFWGYDFTQSMSDKSDYRIYTTPQLIEFHKNVESVYAGDNVAFLKNGLELYIIP